MIRHLKSTSMVLSKAFASEPSPNLLRSHRGACLSMPPTCMLQAVTIPSPQGKGRSIIFSHGRLLPVVTRLRARPNSQTLYRNPET